MRALSTSKMPPQQPDRLLDLVDDRLDFCAHFLNPQPPCKVTKDVAAVSCGRNGRWLAAGPGES
jgi:hypothetical protein